jgi:hypothetical protein
MIKIADLLEKFSAGSFLIGAFQARLLAIVLGVLSMTFCLALVLYVEKFE